MHNTQQITQARNNAQHYANSAEFLGMFEAGSFDEEVDCGARWVGLVRDAAGMLQVHAEYVYDKNTDGAMLDSGKGWWL